MKLKRSQVKKIVFKKPQGGGGGGGGGGQPKPPSPTNTETWQDEDEQTISQPPSNGNGSGWEEEGEDEGTPGQGGGRPMPPKNKDKNKGDSDENVEEDEEGEGGSSVEDELKRIFDEKIAEQGTGFDQKDDGDLPVLINPDTDDDRYDPEGDVEINEVLRGAEQIRQQEREKSEKGGKGANIAGERGGIKNVPVHTDWKKELQKFVTPTEKKVHTYMQPNRRLLGLGILQPTRRPVTEEKLDIVVAMDTSGSVTKPLLNTFMNEIISIIEKFPEIKFKLLFFTSRVYAEVDIDTTNGSYKNTKKEDRGKGVQYIKITSVKDATHYLKNLHFYDSGGTVIESIAPYLNSIGIKEISGLLVFTDGDNNNPNIDPFPTIKNNNVLFLINKGGNTSIVRKYGPFILIDIEHSQD